MAKEYNKLSVKKKKGMGSGSYSFMYAGPENKDLSKRIKEMYEQEKFNKKFKEHSKYFVATSNELQQVLYQEIESNGIFDHSGKMYHLFPIGDLPLDNMENITVKQLRSKLGLAGTVAGAAAGTAVAAGTAGAAGDDGGGGGFVEQVKKMSKYKIFVMQKLSNEDLKVRGLDVDEINALQGDENAAKKVLERKGGGRANPMMEVAEAVAVAASNTSTLKVTPKQDPKKDPKKEAEEEKKKLLRKNMIEKVKADARKAAIGQGITDEKEIVKLEEAAESAKNDELDGTETVDDPGIEMKASALEKIILSTLKNPTDISSLKYNPTSGLDKGKTIELIGGSWYTDTKYVFPNPPELGSELDKVRADAEKEAAKAAKAEAENIHKAGNAAVKKKVYVDAMKNMDGTITTKKAAAEEAVKNLREVQFYWISRLSDLITKDNKVAIKDLITKHSLIKANKIVGYNHDANYDTIYGEIIKKKQTGGYRRSRNKSYAKYSKRRYKLEYL